MSIGTRIREARIGKKMTQPELAEKIGVTKGAIANYENEISVPKHEILYKLMIVLGVDANFLYQDLIKEISNDIILDSEEKEIIRMFRKLDDSGKAVIKRLLHQLTDEK